MTRTLYTILLWLALPVLIIRLGIRAIRNKAYRHRWPERFGGGTPAKPCRLWIHAVSVGEVNAATPLIHHLLESQPALEIVVTTMTPTGAQRVRDTFGTAVQHRYAPYDYPFAVGRFLRRFRPQALVLMETEIWPNIIAQCFARDIAVVMANVRLSAKSARGYRLVLPLIRPTLEKVSVMAAQSERDKQNLMGLGVSPDRIHLTGSTKFEIDVPPSVAEVALAVRRDWGVNRPILVAGSTHDGEETILLEALRKLLPSHPDLLLIIAPRHPERFESVGRLIEKMDFKMSRRTDAQHALDASIEVQLANTMGELLTLYAAADIAIVGGSLMPIRGIGGHNILEPCAVGVPVVFGSNMGNFLEITRLTLAEKAGFQVRDENELLEILKQLLDDASLRTSVGENGRALIQRNLGATAQTLSLIKPFLTAK